MILQTVVSFPLEGVIAKGAAVLGAMCLAILGFQGRAIIKRIEETAAKVDEMKGTMTRWDEKLFGDYGLAQRVNDIEQDIVDLDQQRQLRARRRSSRDA